MRYQTVKIEKNHKHFVWGWFDSLETALRHCRAVNVPENDLRIGDCETGKLLTLQEAESLTVIHETYYEPTEQDLRDYRIINKTSGADMGIYRSATEDEALQAMLDAAGDSRPIMDRSDWIVETK